MKFEIVHDFTFEAAHFLPAVPEGHRCRRLHGHTYKVSLHVEGPLDPQQAWVMDFQVLSDAFAPVLARLDHHLLNEVPGLENPTAEAIGAFILAHLSEALPGLCQVVVHENPVSRAIVRR